MSSQPNFNPQYYENPAPKRKNNTWLGCGIIALAVVCLGSVAALVGWFALEGATKESPQANTILPTAAPISLSTQPSLQTNLTTTPPNHIPYEAVVQIIAMVNLDGDIQPGWTGSGSIISSDGLILTNAHVVLSDAYYTVDHLVIALTVAQDAPAQAAYLAEIIQADAALDLAVLRITKDLNNNPVVPSSLNLPAVPLGDSDQLQLGDPITILGYPGIGGETITLTRGEVSGFTGDRVFGNRSFIKTSATIAGGNSGGMATNSHNELIGVPTQVGYGGEGDIVDCRALADTNGDGLINTLDSCIPTGGFINALRPIKLAMPLIEAAKRGEQNIIAGTHGEQIQESTGAVLMSDDFNKDNSLWDIGGSQNGEVRFKNGELWFHIIPMQYYFWSSWNGNTFTNAVISVDARVEAPTGSGDFGIICRLQDGNNFYALEVSEDRYFAIWKMVNGQSVFLKDWTYSGSIPENTSMTITATCTGNKLALAVNNLLLAEVRDDTFQSGWVGLLAGTFETGNIIVAFDNYVVRKP
ncbi:MAG: serine protease [Anaerolineales bacterium]|jgi:S1-C subfamily serine protease